jgi:hypothetical protein
LANSIGAGAICASGHRASTTSSAVASRVNQRARNCTRRPRSISAAANGSASSAPIAAPAVLVARSMFDGTRRGR